MGSLLASWKRRTENYGISIVTLLSLIVVIKAARLPYTSEFDCGSLTNQQSCVESNCECAWCSLQIEEERDLIHRSGTDGFCFKKGGKGGKGDEDQKRKIEGVEDGSGNCDGGQVFENGSCIGNMEVGLVVLLVALGAVCVFLCFLGLCCKFCWCL